MSDVQPMKPQDTVIYLLGELKGEVRSTTQAVTAASTAQAAVNSEHAKEHESFRKAIEANTLDLAAIKASTPVRVSTWSKAGVIIAVPASVVALVGFIIVYLQPN